MVIMKWRLQKRKSWLTPWLLGISSVLPYLHGNYSRLSIKGTYVSYHTICQCRWLRFLLEQRAVLSLDGVLAEIHFWPHQICIWAGFFFFFFRFLIHSLNSLFIFLFERKVVGLDENMLGIFVYGKVILTGIRLLQKMNLALL